MNETYYCIWMCRRIRNRAREKKTLRKGFISPEGYVIFFLYIIFIFMDSKIKHVCIEFNESKNTNKKIFYDSVL